MKILPKLSGGPPVLKQPFLRQPVVLDEEACGLVFEVCGVKDELAAGSLKLPPHHSQTLVEFEVLVGLVDHELLVLDLVDGLDAGPIQTWHLFNGTVFFLRIALLV